ncbi:MAG TPA: hypothetical protein VGH87_12200 [Polyangiaceae bacterium]|jgi:hypothetical protein
MKLCLISFGFLVACSGGAESSLMDPAQPASDPVATDDASAVETSAPITLPEPDASTQEEDAATQTCTGYADPQTTGTCHACTGSNCQANGCFGGWYCKLDTQKCVAKPDGC